MAQKRQRVLSGPALERAALYAQMPPWFDRSNNFTMNKDTIHLNFNSPCSCGKSQQAVYVGKAQGTELASKLAKAVSRVHAGCHAAAAKSIDSVTLETRQAEISDLEKQLARQKRKAGEFEAENAVLLKKVERGSELQAQAVTDKRLKTAATSKRQPIDTANQVDFEPRMKSHVMIGPKGYEPGPPTYILDTLEYHCSGSERKLLTIVLDLIKRCSLEDAVVGALGAATESIAGYIVQRARAALQELKQCQSEGQRQQYRTILTALAPEDGKAAPVAAALGVGRQKQPFLDAIAKRAEIGRQIKANKKRLQVGDEVLCRHGKGKVVELDSDYESEDENTAHPCTVELNIDGNTFISKFSRTGSGKGGARLHRVPISFAHGSRSTREDATSAEVEQLVSGCNRRCCD